LVYAGESYADSLGKEELSFSVLWKHRCSLANIDPFAGQTLENAIRNQPPTISLPITLGNDVGDSDCGEYLIELIYADAIVEEIIPKFSNSTGVIQLFSSDHAHVGTYTVGVKVSLVNYPSRFYISDFTLELTPCIVENIMPTME